MFTTFKVLVQMYTSLQVQMYTFYKVQVQMYTTLYFTSDAHLIESIGGKFSHVCLQLEHIKHSILLEHTTGRED